MPGRALAPGRFLIMRTIAMRFSTKHALLAAAVLIPLPALANDTTIGSVIVEQPWTRATPPGARVAGGYLVLENVGSATDRLVALSSPAADRVEVHEMAMDNGVMVMRPRSEGVEVPPGERVSLEPGGIHLMLIDLKAGVTAGQAVPVTLTFASGASSEISLAAQPLGAKGPAGAQGGKAH